MEKFSSRLWYKWAKSQAYGIEELYQDPVCWKLLGNLRGGAMGFNRKGRIVHNQTVVPDPATPAFDVVARMPTVSDEDVMEQLSQGHPEALPTLFDRFYRLVLKIALRILRDPGEAEDLMQDVFFEIYNKAAQFDPARGSTKNLHAQREISAGHTVAVGTAYGTWVINGVRSHEIIDDFSGDFAIVSATLTVR